MRIKPTAPASSPRRLRNLALPLAIACAGTILFVAPAAADPPPPPNSEPNPTTTPAPQPPAPPPAELASGGEQPAAPNVVEQAQGAIVGVVTLWREPEDPWAWLTTFAPTDPAAENQQPPVMSLCTGFFDTPSTIVTAGHCVDPAEGRQALDWERMEVDPETGMPIPPPPGRPEPARTVIVFQPRELPGRVVDAPTEARVHSFRTANEGDTAKLELHGKAPATPLPIAASDPTLGDEVTSIGFPGFNVRQTDGVDMAALLSGGNPAKTLEDSRLQPVSSSGTVTARQYEHGTAVFQTNADLAPGTSGGPVINSRGEVLGVNSQMTVAFFAQNYNRFTNTGMLREFLGLDTPPPPAVASTSEPTNAPSAAPPPPANPNAPMLSGLSTDWLTPLPILVATIFGGITIWLLMRHKNRSSATRPTHQTTPGLYTHAPDNVSDDTTGRHSSNRQTPEPSA